MLALRMIHTSYVLMLCTDLVHECFRCSWAAAKVDEVVAFLGEMQDLFIHTFYIKVRSVESGRWQGWGTWLHVVRSGVGTLHQHSPFPVSPDLTLSAPQLPV